MNTEKEKVVMEPEFLCEGLVYCGCCGRKLDVVRAELKKQVCSVYACRSGCIHSIRVDELDAKAWHYVKSVTNQEFQQDVKFLMRDAVETRVTREVIAIRQKVEAFMNDLEAMKRRPEVIRMPDKLIDWVDRPLPDRAEMIRQAEEEVKRLHGADDNCDEYYSVSVPVDPCKQFKEACKAVRWYVERIIIHETTMEFASTLNGWLGGKSYRRLAASRLTRWKRNGFEGRIYPDVRD